MLRLDTVLRRTHRVVQFHSKWRKDHLHYANSYFYRHLAVTEWPLFNNRWSEGRKFAIPPHKVARISKQADLAIRVQPTKLSVGDRCGERTDSERCPSNGGQDVDKMSKIEQIAVPLRMAANLFCGYGDTQFVHPRMFQGRKR